ncbi:hypothetical protein [Pseudomonas nitroreducens]|uniref:hypothetical protein n=1 Tax=Pseudomonas nitroreducens TaxID=46680 RepID=UPI002D7F24B3|nr:hypothetical protein [Pseudomonas nitroreducens]
MSEQPCENEKPLLVVKLDRLLTKEQTEAFTKTVEREAGRLGMNALLLTGDADAHIEQDLRPLLSDLLAEQRNTNRLLVALVEAMAYEPEHELSTDVVVQRDLSGKPIKLPQPPGANHG